MNTKRLNRYEHPTNSHSKHWCLMSVEKANIRITPQFNQAQTDSIVDGPASSYMQMFDVNFPL